eukprot:scaffold214665_cov48-Prasinocladus_malaysianus.AAC.1
MRRSPLSFAIKGNNYLVVRLLIEKGADLKLRILEYQVSNAMPSSSLLYRRATLAWGTQPGKATG